jgi:hypothetical protein
MTEQATARQSQAWAAEAGKLDPAVIRDGVEAVQKFGSPELTKLLNDSGMGNSPLLIQAFARALRSNPYHFRR